MSAVIALVIFVVAFFFIATEKVDKVKVVLIAAAAMAVFGLIPGAEVFFSEHEGIDWRVIFLLLGMMIIVGVIKQTGIFDYLAIWAAKKSRGKPYRLMVLLMLITAVASPFLDNVTTIMLVAPVTVVVCNRLHIPAQPYLIAEVLASNIGGAATLIGDPPNIIIGSRAGLTFGDFLVHGSDRRRDLRRVRAVHPGAVPQVLPLQPRTRRVGDGAAGAAGHHRRAPAGALPDRPRLCRARLRVALRAAHRPVVGRPGRRRGDGAGLEAGHLRGAGGGGVADAGLLHGPVRDGRGAGAYRCHRHDRRVGDQRGG